MNLVAASEVKRRGLAVLEEHLKAGPVHVIKNNRPACVVLSEEDYADLLKKAHQEESQSLWSLLDYHHWEGKKSKKEIARQMKKERSSWKDS